MSDKELDDLFKDASGKQNTPYDADNWKHLEKVLNEGSPIRAPFWNWKKYTFLSILFVISSSILVLNKVQNNNSIEDKSITSVTKPTEEPSIKNELGDQNSATTKEANDSPSLSVNKINDVVALKNKVELKRLLNSEQEPKSKFKSTETLNDVADKNKKLKSVDAVERSMDSGDGNFNKMLDNASPVIAATDSTSRQITDRSNPLKFNVSEEDTTSEKSKKPEEHKTVLADSASESTKSEEEKKKRENSFSIKLAIAPDYSSVGYFSPGKTGLNYGLEAEYLFSKHFSISAGAIWSKKLYQSDYSEPPVYGVVLNSKKINGDCRILDVPITVNYYFNPGQRFVFYVSTGLSSYIMFKEDYNYEVIKSGKNYDYTTHIERKNNEWFKMVNASIGMQYHISNHWYVQAEPFVKAPLSGIGQLNIKLVSTGVFVKIKYTIK